MLSNREAQKLLQLEEDARNCYLDKTDWDILDWMSEEDRKEYLRLYRKDTGECMCCGEQGKQKRCNCK